MPGSPPARQRQPCGDAPGLEVSRRAARCASRRNKVLEHGFLQLGLRQRLFEPGVLLFQMSQPPRPASPVLLSPAVVDRLRHLQDPADIGDGLALGDQLLGGLEFADDLLGCEPGAFHGEVPGPVWPAEDSHSPWTGFQSPRQ